MIIAETITVFLMDGDASGRIKASIENWTGLGYKIPRNRLDDCEQIPSLSQSSVYFLFGDSTNDKSPVYIGQASNRKNGKGILQRLKEHNANPEKDYWTDAIVFTTKDNSFGSTELNYLENLFCNLAIKAGRYEVKNANDPAPGNITEEKESSLKRYASYAELILGVFGYKVFRSLAEYERKVALPTKEKYDSQILLAGGGKASKYLRSVLASKGYITSNWNFTLASLNKGKKDVYWANPRIEFLKSEWLLVLNDNKNRELHFFKIPADAIDSRNVKTRSKGKLIQLEVVKRGGDFVCRLSGIVFQPWYDKTISY